MKTLFISVFIFSTTLLSAQQTDSLGLGSNDTLTKYEINYLNSVYKVRLDTFYNFQNLQIAFFSQNSGIKILSKKEFFDTCIKPAVAKGELPKFSFAGFSPDEKLKSGGYDLYFVSPSGLFDAKQKKKVVKQLGEMKKSSGK